MQAVAAFLNSKPILLYEYKPVVDPRSDNVNQDLVEVLLD